MNPNDDSLTVPLGWRIRDRLFTILIRALIKPFGLEKQPSNFLSNPAVACLLTWFARLYGFDIKQVLKEKTGQRAAWNLLTSISNFGIETPQRFRAPVSVVWSLSYRCNLRCKHCYQDASQPSADELTIEEQLQLVHQLSEAGVSMIVLSGGEPLTNPNLERLIAEIRAHGMLVSIDSNGVLLDAATVEYLRQLGVRSVELSLDSSRAEAHDNFRGLKGAFERTLNAVELCSKAGIFTTVATTVTTLNHSDSRSLIRLARSHGAHRVVFFDLIPAGRARGIQDVRLSPSQLVELMSLVRQECSRERVEVFTELPQYVAYSSCDGGDSGSDDPVMAMSVERFTVSSFFDCSGRNNINRKFAAYLGGCPAGRLYCNIQPNGDVTPCMFMPEYPVAGNIRQQSFVDIWKSQTFEVLRERRLKGKCRLCKFLTTCGGCRAKALAYQGDYLNSDPTCLIQARS